MDQTFADLRITDHPQTLRTIALERLRGAIVDGRFRSGERLVERTLCAQLGVSRTIVREAIRTLEAEGLVQTGPRKGPMVASLDWATARQIYDIRLLLEQGAVSVCATVADDAVKGGLRTAFDRLEMAFTKRGDDLLGATTDFYRVIFAAAGHDVAWEVVQRLNGRISRLRALTLATEDRRVSGPARMACIRDAILANDPEAASTAVHDHLTEAAAIARRLLDPRSASAEPR